MEELREQIASERRRLRKVRQALSSAVAQSAGSDKSWIPFYVAIADYFEAAMDRLHTQDIRMGDLLREKADMNDPDNQAHLAELDRRLDGNQQHLRKFLAARQRLKDDEGAEAIRDFEEASRAYTGYITSNMGHHGGSTDLAREHFGEDDWVYMANVSDEDAAREEALFERVFATMPASLDLIEES